MPHLAVFFRVYSTAAKSYIQYIHRPTRFLNNMMTLKCDQFDMHTSTSPAFAQEMWSIWEGHRHPLGHPAEDWGWPITDMCQRATVTSRLTALNHLIVLGDTSWRHWAIYSDTSSSTSLPLIKFNLFTNMPFSRPLQINVIMCRLSSSVTRVYCDKTTESSGLHCKVFQ